LFIIPPEAPKSEFYFTFGPIREKQLTTRGNDANISVTDNDKRFDGKE
jgi:hypothetical protein